MTLRPCIIIPVFRHARPLKSWFRDLQKLQYPIILVDDGNPKEEQNILIELSRSANVDLIIHSDNQGKGGAVFSALKKAEAEGYTHAVQIDADGQHDYLDIPKFLRVSENNPAALILGVPTFDRSAPTVHVWGRKLTTFFIWLETLSTKVKDGLFGFRVYPVTATLTLYPKGEIKKRMGFDTEVIVRALWNEMEVINIPSKVTYPEDGISNFHYLKDNVRLIRLHSGLLVRGLCKTPNLIRRKIAKKSGFSGWYAKKEHGSLTALRLVLFLYRIGGTRLLHVLAYPVVSYFFIKDAQARKASREYLTRLQRYAPRLAITSNPKNVYKHFLHFGCKIISSLEGWKGDIPVADIRWKNTQAVFDLIDQGQGGVVLSAHFGCLEVTRSAQKHRKGLKVIPLMYLKNSKTFRAFLQLINPAAEANIIPVEDINPAVAMQMHKRISAGDFVAVLADRLPPGSEQRFIEVSLLGEPAGLPVGPFALAVTLDCPVFSFFSSYYDEKESCYRAEWQRLEAAHPENKTAREQEMQRLAKQFAILLEEKILEAPFQWFNFYDFWLKRENVISPKEQTGKKQIANQ